jgi:hypothetical protein
VPGIGNRAVGNAGSKARSARIVSGGQIGLFTPPVSQ